MKAKISKPASCIIISVVFLIFCATAVFIFFPGVFENEQENKLVKDNDPALAELDWETYYYRPFPEGEDSKLATLDEPSTLKLTDNLPRLDGATALFPIYSAFMTAVYPKGVYTEFWYDDAKPERFRLKQILCSTTPHAYKRLINGHTDIIFVGTPSKDQLSMARDNGVELEFTPIGYEAFVFFVNKENKVNSLTTEQIQGIYSGKINNWQKVGGKYEKIKAYQRQNDSGSQNRMIKFMGDKPLMNPPTEMVAADMSGVIEVTADYRNKDEAIGYSFLFYASEIVKNNDIKLLALDGVKPTRENITNKTYPQSNEFYAVTLKDNKNPNVDKFIQWILSPQGQELVEKTGYTPLSSKE